MSFTVSVGETDFAVLRSDNAYYVDKTEIIYELVHDTNNKVTLFTRPRRFGKTLMMSMMENFFSIRKDSKNLFENLAIAKHKKFCKKWMNHFPVLYVSFNDVEAEDFSDAYDMLKARIAEVCKDFSSILDADMVDSDDRRAFLRLKSESGRNSDVKNSIKTIMRMLYTIYGKQVVLLIDEYDVPLAKASEKDTSHNLYYSRMLDVIKGIMSTALKDNEFLKFAVVTGCRCIAKGSIFTGTNNFASYSVLDEDFSGYFGFSDNEVGEILKAADRSDKADVIKEWYDGYMFGDSYVYCPWDVINYLSDLKKCKDARPKNYWGNTSHNDILLTFIKRTEFDVTGKFEKLLNGGNIVWTISDELTYDKLYLSEDNLWSILLMTGYITKVDTDEDSDMDMFFLRIPNKEVASIFQDAVVRYFTETVDSDVIKEMIDSLWEEDTSIAAEILSDLLWGTISYNDYHEEYYNAFLAGVFAGRGYEVESYKEKGLGRPDIFLKDRKNRRAIIIESKKSARESNLDKDCYRAIKQIIDEKYSESIVEYDQILCYDIEFSKKHARIELKDEWQRDILMWRSDARLQNNVEDKGKEKKKINMCRATAALVERGEKTHLIEQICKKLAKGKSVEVIADEVEESVDRAQMLCDMIREISPDYDAYKVYEAMNKN